MATLTKRIAFGADQQNRHNVKLLSISQQDKLGSIIEHNALRLHHRDGNRIYICLSNLPTC